MARPFAGRHHTSLCRRRRRDDAPRTGQGRRLRQAADAVSAQGCGAAIAGKHMNIMWRQNSPTPRNCSLRDGAATYPRPTHKNGYVARYIALRRRRLRVPLAPPGPGQAARLRRHRSDPDDEAAGGRSVHVAAGDRRRGPAVGAAVVRPAVRPALGAPAGAADFPSDGRLLRGKMWIRLAGASIIAPCQLVTPEDMPNPDQLLARLIEMEALVERQRAALNALEAWSAITSRAPSRRLMPSASGWNW